MATKPAMQVCPVCGHDDFVDLSKVDDEWVFRCEDAVHPALEWRPTVKPGPVPGRTGIGEELGVYETLLGCIDDRLTEWGVIEYRFWQADPDTYRHLLGRYGHTAIASTKYSTSSFLGGALGQLWREGLIEHMWVKGTGRWKYLSRCSGGAMKGSPTEDVLTWADFAAGKGIDPDTWPPTADFA